jgi:hypothetical protein
MEDAVMFPSVRVIAGVVDGFATTPLIPFAVVTLTFVTEPPVTGAQDADMALTAFTAHEAVPNKEPVGDKPLGGAQDALTEFKAQLAVPLTGPFTVSEPVMITEPVSS